MNERQAVRAVILKKNIFSEGNEIVTMYSRELGKVRGVARAVKKMQSKLAHGLQTLFDSQLELLQSRGKLSIIGARPRNTFKHLRESVRAVNAALFGAEVLLKSTADEQPNAALFDYFVKFLEHLDAEPAGPHSCWNFFGWQALGLTGYKVQTAACALCGKELPFETEFFFSNRKGGFLCADCAKKTADAKPVRPEIYRAFASLAPDDFSAQDHANLPQKELQALSREFIQHILERDLKSFRYLV